VTTSTAVDRYIRDSNPAGESRLRVRFYYDPNSVVIPVGQTHSIIDFITAGSTPRYPKL
jgi:hypothetical protein